MLLFLEADTTRKSSNYELNGGIPKKTRGPRLILKTMLPKGGDVMY